MKNPVAHLRLLPLWLLFFGSLLPAQEDKIFFEHYGVPEGLTEASVQALLQDRQGFVWIGTQDGLLRFDGYELTPVWKADVWTTVDYLHEDKEGNIWVATGENTSLLRYNPETGKFKDYTFPAPNGDARIISFIFEDSHDNLWLLTYGNWIRLNKKTGAWSFYPFLTFYPHRFGIYGGADYVSIAEDLNGDIWVGSREEGVFRYDVERDSLVRTLTHRPGDEQWLLSDEITMLTADSSGFLWIGTSEGISRYDIKSDSFKHYTTKAGKPLGTAFQLDRHQRLWMVRPNDRSLSYIDLSANKVHTLEPEALPIPAGLRYQHGIPIAYNEEVIWFLLVKGYSNRSKVPAGFLSYYYKDDEFRYYDERFNHPGNVPQTNVGEAFLDDQGLLWTGNMWGGFSKEDARRRLLDLYQHDPANPASLPNDTINAILEDRRRQLWIGTNRGLSRFSPDEQTFVSYPYQPSNRNRLSHPQVNVLMEDSTGRLWIGTGNGLCLFDPQKQTFTQYLKDPENPNPIRRILEEKGGRLWINITDKGVGIFNPDKGTFELFFEPDGPDETALLGFNLQDIHQDSRGAIWLSFNDSQGVCRYIPETQYFRRYSPDYLDTTSIVGTNIMNIQEDDRGNVWFMSNGRGVSRYLPEKDHFANYHPPNLVTVKNFIEDKEGHLWFGCFIKGLHRYDPKREQWRYYSEQDGLIHNTLQGFITKGLEGHIWYPTARGISRFDPRTETFRNFRHQDGFQRSGNRTRYRILTASNGNIWVGGQNGLNRIRPDHLTLDQTIPKVWITALTISGETYRAADSVLLEKSPAYTERMRLSYDQNDLTVEFVGLQYARPTENLYRWKLENFDEEWTLPSKERKARYTNLSPGTYTFRVQAANADGIWNEEGAGMEIVIAPPWWQTLWAYLLYGLLILTGFYVFYRWRTKTLQRQNQQLEATVAQRTQQLSKRVDELSTVNEISRAAAGQLQFNELIRLVGEQMRARFDAQIAYVAILDGDTRTIRFPYQFGDEIPPLRLGEGLTSRVIQSGESLLINDEVEEAYRRYELEEVGIVPKSYLGVPVPVSGEVIGVLSVQRTDNKEPFDESDRRLLSTIAANVGIAIHNARLFQEAQEARVVAEEANEAKSSFLSTISHELRTPLTSVIGFAKIIRKRLEERLFPMLPKEDKKTKRTTQQVSENLNVVISEGERLTNLINDILDLAKIESGRIDWKMEELPIGEVIDRAAAATNILFAEKSLPLYQDIAPGLPPVNGDRDRLQQVLINLLSNAVKFTDQGSVTIIADHRNGEVVVRVQDTGIGIAEEEQGKIFEKFKQAGDTLTDKPKGTGLGLPICKEIVEHHGGKLWVESVPGKGSIFAFSLPLVSNTPQPIELMQLMEQLKTRVQYTAPAGDNGPPTILVVDDEAHIRNLLHQELSDSGYLIREASNGREAVEEIRRHRPDLVILDVMMPEMNGFDVAAVLKNDPKTMDIPILILSIVQDKERGYRLGVDRYLTKPIDTELLFQEVDILLRQSKSRKKVIVVDEDASTMRTLTEALKAHGYEVEVSNGPELIEKAIRSKPDIVILNTLQDNQGEIIRTLRFEKGMEKVLFLLYQ